MPARPATAVVAALPAAPPPPPLAPTRPAGPATAAVIPAPDPALLEPSPYGPVPRVGSDGRTSIRAYGRLFARDDTRPRVALIVGGLGLNAALSEEAIRRLPPTVGLAFSPYASRTEALAERARARGMEMLIALPLEPSGYPLNDPGERALLTTLAPAENMDRLLWSLSRLQGYVGAIGALGPMRGERFAQVPGLLAMVQDGLRERGLLYVDPRPVLPAGSPARAFGRNVDVVLDEPATRGEIERRLEELERQARERGSALGIAGDASPVLVDRVSAWAAGLEGRGLVLAPVTALIRRPDGRPEGRGEARPEAAAR
ncbi:divergent polysaccharide deacetylase family protein [Roseomonas sp. OT10]|uniref:divergent polysaccharide deacetylase family protein n=1 Tax=Roseomonas cutis TaxID=2897332 RepID=UPI001E659D45|nr:divergent polysaccharide deacetylase family protein [Roseomonas sp. OT10]UFN51208.1 divergent polysaccharide deacetylase family protein [Roseomonas sp. OT10]